MAQIHNITLMQQGIFAGKKVKTTALTKKNFFSPQTNLGTYVNLYSYESSMK